MGNSYLRIISREGERLLDTTYRLAGDLIAGKCTQSLSSYKRDAERLYNKVVEIMQMNFTKVELDLTVPLRIKSNTKGSIDFCYSNKSELICPGDKDGS